VPLPQNHVGESVLACLCPFLSSISRWELLLTLFLALSHVLRRYGKFSVRALWLGSQCACLTAWPSAFPMKREVQVKTSMLNTKAVSGVSSIFHKSEDRSFKVVLLFIGESWLLNSKGWMSRQELYCWSEKSIDEWKTWMLFVFFFYWNMGVIKERYDVRRKETVLYSNVDFEMVNIIFKAKTW